MQAVRILQRPVCRPDAHRPGALHVGEVREPKHRAGPAVAAQGTAILLEPLRVAVRHVGACQRPALLPGERQAGRGEVAFLRVKAPPMLCAAGDAVEVDGVELMRPHIHQGDQPPLPLIRRQAVPLPGLPPDQWQRRLIALVDVGPHQFYAVDFYRIAGGTEHWWSFHAQEGDFATTGLSLTRQQGGTLAGPDVPYGDPKWLKENGCTLSSYGWSGPMFGFAHLSNVERARPE